MTEKVKNEYKAAEEERKIIAEDLEKSKRSFAEYIIRDKAKIEEMVAHPYVVTKKDVRKRKRQDFLNKLKKVFGL